MMAAGRVYTHFEHHMVLQKLAGRVLLAVVALAGVLGLLLWKGHSVAAAVAIMAGYRVIYLLTNLEFWGVSAVVFDVRQSKRLFGLISAGDMPAKALGAGLAIVIHAHTDLLYLLLTAFLAYGAALLVVQATLRLHDVEARPVGRRQREPGTSRWRQWFGDNNLVLSICLSLLAISAVTTGVEYSFFVNVKHKFHDQATVMHYVGGVLVLTYLLAMLFKIGLAQVTLDRLGIRRMLLALPGTVLLGLVAFGALSWAGAGESLLLVLFLRAVPGARSAAPGRVRPGVSGAVSAAGRARALAGPYARQGLLRAAGHGPGGATALFITDPRGRGALAALRLDGIVYGRGAVLSGPHLRPLPGRIAARAQPPLFAWLRSCVPNYPPPLAISKTSALFPRPT